MSVGFSLCSCVVGFIVSLSLSVCLSVLLRLLLFVCLFVLLFVSMFYLSVSVHNLVYVFWGLYMDPWPKY